MQNAAIATMVVVIAAVPNSAPIAQPIENELVLITPVAKGLVDPVLAEFTRYAKQKLNVSVRTSALAAGAPLAYGRIVEWKGHPQADIFWGGESALFDRLRDQKLIDRHDLSKSTDGSVPLSVGKPIRIPLKDPKGFWTGTLLEPCGLVYHPRLFQRFGLPAPTDWNDLLDPKLKGTLRRARPQDRAAAMLRTKSFSSGRATSRAGHGCSVLRATLVFLPLAAVRLPSVVARCEFAAGFAVPSYGL